MTIKIIRGKSFKGLINYNSKESKGEEIASNFFAETNQEKIQFLEYVGKSNDNIKTKSCHIVLAFSPDDKPKLDDYKMEEIAEEYLTKMNFSNKDDEINFPYVVYRHDDTDHPHLHIVMSRTDFQGKMIQDRNSARASMPIIKELEKKHDLVQHETKSKTKKREVSKNLDKNNIERNKREKGISKKELLTIKQKLADRVSHALSRRPTIGEFAKSMKIQDIEIQPRYNKKDELVGIAFRDLKSDNTFKGSAIGWKASKFSQGLTIMDRDFNAQEKLTRQMIEIAETKAKERNHLTKRTQTQQKDRSKGRQFGQ